ncbi:MAG TPA: TIGR03435 family protein, partial [Vicinamibacterales bacterium]|nr:TIGR03435 family protein [Vicinamibacterales bacterium]
MSRSPRRINVVVGLLVVASHLQAQSVDQKAPAFEVASVKVSNSGSFAKEIGPAPDGRFHATNVPARDLIAFAYGISQDSTAVRIVGVPRWVDDERYDVNAKVGGAWTLDRMREMVRAMLTDRFKLAAHHETRDMP